MTREGCPSTEDLLLLLNEQLDPDLMSDLAGNVDGCPRCQEDLEELTRGHAYGLSVLSADLLGGAPGDAAHDGPEPPCRNADTDVTSDPSAAAVDRSVPGPEATTDHDLLDPLRVDASRRPGNGGPIIPSYEIISLIREGGMGVVYQARQLGLNRIVALKMIRGDRAHPHHFARFRIEAEAVARLKHPNIVQIYEIGEVDSLPFLSLEFLEGGTLDDRLAGNPQPGRAAATLMVTLARAVQVAHDAGIVHRDLKPSNILFDADGTPKITDFGLAKRLESDSRQTESGQIMGTPCYMAPEQARGHTRDVAAAADVYALGAILYEMLTGRPPFKGETPLETVRQVVEDEVVPPSRLVPRIARDLETICLHCLNKEPARRYESAQALAEDLENYLAGRPIKARRTPLWERAIKLTSRHPVAATFLFFSLSAAIAGGGYALQARVIQQENTLREQLRIADLNAKVLRTHLQAQELLSRQEWSEAEVALTRLQAEVRDEPIASDLHRRTGELLEQASRGRSTQETRQRARQRLGTFRERHRDALYQETHFQWLGRPPDPDAVRESARSALAVFAPGSDESWTLEPLPESLTAAEQDEVKEGQYELLLILAGAEEPDRSLQALDAAGKLGLDTRALHLRRADCLAQAGDQAAAGHERRIAEALPLASPLDHFLEAKELYRQGNWAEALAHFDTTLARQPGHFWANGLSAFCCLQLQRPVPAWSRLTACLQLEPDLAWLYELRGFTSYQIAGLARLAAENLHARGDMLHAEIEHQLQAAEADYKRAIELLDAAPSPPVRYAVLLNRGLLWLERKDWDKAAADLNAAMQLDDRQWQPFEIMGQVYQRKNQPDQAIEQFTRAIAVRPGWAPLYRARAKVNLDRNDQTPAHRAAALSDLDQAIRIEPAASDLVALDHSTRARLLHRDGREDEALAECNAALKITPGHFDASRVRVDVLRKLKRYDEVIRSCDALLNTGKPSSELYELRALAKEKLRDYQGAIEDQTLAIALKPGAAVLLARRGALYLVTDAPRSALRDFDKAIGLDSTSADAHLGRGLAIVALGQHREAVVEASKALAMAEPTVTRLYNAARIYAQAAISAASDARRTGPDAVNLVSHYQDRASDLVQQWLRRLPAADRAGALRELLLDPAMASLRRRIRSFQGG